MLRRVFCKLLLVAVAVFSFLAFSGVLFAQGRSEDAFERVKEVQERHTEKLMAKKGVVGTAIGLNDKGKHIVMVLLEKDGVPGVPQELEGVPVRPVVSGKFYAFVDPTARFPRPVPIGVSTGHPDITAGTIACRVKDSAGNVYALSNNHVYADENQANIGDAVIQPGRYDGGSSPADDIGTLADFEEIKFDGSPNTIDAAIALSLTGDLGNATPSDGYGTPKSTTATAYPLQSVQKYGRTTGLTSGIIIGINMIVNVGYSSGVALFEDQIAIAYGNFSKPGDSGSLIVTNPGKQPVGLLFAGSTYMTIANPIGPVLSRFGVTIDDGSEEPVGNPPAVDITNPANNATVSGTVNVTADATDDNGVTKVEFFLDDASIVVDTSAPYEVTWDSTTVDDSLYFITATATDTTGQTASDSIMVVVHNVNSAPIVVIANPSDGATFASGSSIPFVGMASDVEDGDLTASIDWISSIDDLIGRGGSFSAVLSNGSHNITAEVTDSGGETGSDSVTITVATPENEPPTVSIKSPADGSTFSSGSSILFEGTASDVEDGYLTTSIIWTSDLDGQIGTGGSVSTNNLSEGTHAITASVTDSGDKTASDSITITVGTPLEEPTTVSVDSITYATQGGKGGTKHLLITAALLDDLNNPVAGASVSIDLFLNEDESPYTVRTNTTGINGIVVFKLSNAPSGYYITTVTGVSAAGLTWDGITPTNGYNKP